ncbi:MAG: cardiolipin synthase [Treponema sp.]|nr:cardiolipin synthase [Treponema sp.]
MRKKWFYKVLGRRISVILILLAELSLLVYLIWSRSFSSKIVTFALNFFSLVISLLIVSKREKGGYKLIWVFLLLSFPFVGGSLYIVLNLRTGTKKFGKKIVKIESETRPSFFIGGNDFEIVRKNDYSYLPRVFYLEKCGFPVYENCEITYLSPGEKFFESLIPELQKAKKYIFMEYFIIEGGKMWGAIYEVLKEKVANGVCVRVLFDDIGCFTTLPSDFKRSLEKDGIHCEIFNPFTPFLSSVQNNRDHRKITVIDGRTAFTGGANLADEYINEIRKHGYWKDAAVLIKGKASWSFTVMFLQMWQFTTGIAENYSDFYPYDQNDCKENEVNAFSVGGNNGFVQPYADSPLDYENVGEHVYLQIISNAKKYVYINTPYLILDDSLNSALCLAAKSGVDIIIVTPHKWDKRIVHLTTRSYYRRLIEAGVKIYEYTNGFIHSKVFISDDITATVGTTNLDFRSLYLHFECGVVLYENDEISTIKADFLKTLEECELISLSKKGNIFTRLFESILRLFAPLM